MRRRGTAGRAKLIAAYGVPPTQQHPKRGEGVVRVLGDAERVWWIVPSGQQIRHAITASPGSRPSGTSVRALCGNSVKLPYDTWPVTREPATRHITERCRECETQVSHRRKLDNELVVTVWDS